jgi:tetratricopeptide (TPR) repeat protein
MKQMLLVSGVFDRFSGGSSSKENSENEYTIEDYQEILDEYKDAEAEIFINIATIYFEQEKIPESMKNLEKSIKLYRELQDVGKQALVLDLMGDINRYNKKIKLALDYYQEAYQLYSEIESDHKDELEKKIKELEVLQSSGIGGKAFNFKNPTIEAISEVPDDKYPSSDYKDISENVEEVIGMLKGADTYKTYANSENPMEELENAYELSDGIGDIGGKATILLIMGDISLKESKTEDALKNFKKSLEYFLEINDKLGEAVSRLLIGTAYYILGNMDNVPQNFRKSIEILRERKDILGENIAMRLMNAIYEEE